MFRNWLKPKWQSTNANKRLSGVAQLKPEQADYTAILEQLASTDPDFRVRLAALRKLSDLNALFRLTPIIKTLLTQTEYERSASSLALHLANVIGQTDTQLEKKLELITTLQHSEFSLYVLNEQAPLDLQLGAIDYVSDANNLYQMALAHPRAKVRIKSAEKLEDITHLRNLANKTKGKDKSIYKIAKTKIEAQHQSSAEQQENMEQCESICNQLESLAQVPSDPLLTQKWTYLKQAWNQCDPSAQGCLAGRVEIANQTIEQIIAARHAAPDPDTINTQDEAHHEQTEAVRILKESIALLRKMDAAQDTDLPSLRAILSTQKIRFESANEIHFATDDLESAFHASYHKLQTYVDAYDTFKKAEQEINKLVSDAQTTDNEDIAQLSKLKHQALKLNDRLAWPYGMNTPTAVAALKNTLKNLSARLADEERIAADIEQQLMNAVKQLETDIESGILKRARKSEQTIKNLLNKLPESRQDKLQAQVKPAKQKLQELRDWQGYATAPKKEALCEEMTKLAQSDIPPPEKAQEIKRLQDEWKSLGPLEKKHEQALWNTFSAQADLAFEPCRQHFQALSDQKKRNLEKRQEICAQLTHYLKHNDWSNTHWLGVIEILKLSKAEWKRYSPVDRAPGKALQEQFNQLLKSIQAKLDSHQASNLRIKQRLIEEVQQLHSDEDVIHAVEQVKKARSQWAKVGMIPKSEINNVQSQFNQACELIFQRRQKLWSDTQAQKAHNQQQIEQAIEQVHALLTSAPDTLSPNHLNDLEQAFSEHQPLEKSVYQRFRKSIDALSGQAKQAIQQAQLNHTQQKLDNLWQQSELCRTLETGVLESNLNSDQLNQIKQQWNTLTDLPEPAMSALNLRFDLAIDALTHGDVAAYRAQQESRLKHLHALTIQMELLAGLDSPAEDHALRMQLQVDRLNENMGQKKQVSTLETRQALETDWCTTGPVSQLKLASLQTRFLAARDKLIQRTQANHDSKPQSLPVD